jgi:hypothetical protein
MLILMASNMAIGQNQKRSTEKKIDLRTQPQPQLQLERWFQDVHEPSIINIVYTQDKETPRLPNPLAVSVRSISPLTARYTAVVEAAFQNIGEQMVRFPVSLEMKLLHQRGSTEHRSFQCSVLALHDGWERVAAVASLYTFMSTAEPNSFVELAPKETAVVRFEAYFSSLF